MHFEIKFVAPATDGVLDGDNPIAYLMDKFETEYGVGFDYDWERNPEEVCDVTASGPTEALIAFAAQLALLEDEE